MADFADFDVRGKSNAGARFHPTPPGHSRPLADVVFWVYGAYSDQVRKLKIDKAREIMLRKEEKRDPSQMTDEEIAQLVEGDPETVAALIANWDGVELHGEPLACNDENRLMLMRDWPWLRRQIDAFAAELENFLPDAPEAGHSG